jgi:4-hydroxy-tetrahydrodipicolinate reductase
MRIGVLGKGKTGGKVIELLSDRSDLEFEVFDRSFEPTLERIKNLNGVISFLPGESFVDMIDMLIKSQVIVISGSTGAALPSNLNERLISENLSWVWASNYSLAMALVRLMLEDLSLASSLLQHPEFAIHEVHHTKKLDSPSGTALSWKHWLGVEAKMTSERTGDVIGFHRVDMSTRNERISLEHEALDRRLFAEGALWSFDKIAALPKDKRPCGLLDFHQLIRQHFGLGA